MRMDNGKARYYRKVGIVLLLFLYWIPTDFESWNELRECNK